MTSSGLVSGVLLGMKLNASKTKTMIVSRPRTMHPQLPPSSIGGTVRKESDDLIILGVTFDAISHTVVVGEMSSSYIHSSILL